MPHKLAQIVPPVTGFKNNTKIRRQKANSKSINLNYTRETLNYEQTLAAKLRLLRQQEEVLPASFQPSLTGLNNPTSTS